jgi:acetolactate synthase-1/2/3 large subunit
LGVAGNNGGWQVANDWLASADVAVLVGTRANATDTSSWTAPDRRARVIQIDISEERAGRNYPSSSALVGDAAAVLEQLTENTPGASEGSYIARTRQLAQARAAWEEAQSGPIDVAPGEVLPRDAIRALARQASADVTVIVDPGTPTPNAAAYWVLDRAGRSVIAPRGHGPMGYAIPASVGVSFARPGRPVVALTADGGFAMCCGELETVSRYQLPVLFVQFTNNSFGWIKMLQHLYFGARYFGVDPGTIDAVSVAKACRLDAVSLTTVDELEKVAADFFDRPRPLYVDIKVPHLIDVTPPVGAWSQALAGRSAERPVY